MIGWLRRHWLPLAVGPLLGLVLAASLMAVAAQRDALRSRDATIDRLERRVVALLDEAKHNSRDLGAARVQIAALAEQVRQLGGKPVVVNISGSGSSSTTAPRSPASPSPSSTTSTTAPARPPSTICLVAVCTKGQP